MQGSSTKINPHIPLDRLLFYALGAAALAYAFLAGLRTIAEFDLWLADGHRPVDRAASSVFSYTAAGQPWTYPIGSGLVFYALYLTSHMAAPARGTGWGICRARFPTKKMPRGCSLRAPTFGGS